MDKKFNCIFCDNEIKKSSIEHIVPESLGNESYVMRPNSICGDCNNSFSKFEAEAIPKTILGLERARLGIKTKKGKPATGEVQEIKFIAHKDLKKNFITAHGVTEEHIVGINEEDNTFQIKVPAFDKNAMPTSKLLLKIGVESIHQSQLKLYRQVDFTELKKYLTKKDNTDWPFITSQTILDSFKSIVTYTDKYNLKKFDCYLNYAHVNSRTLLFQFKYGGAHFITNLVDRNIEWATKYLETDKNARLYPEHLGQRKAKRDTGSC
jgi:hypothetical protein